MDEASLFAARLLFAGAAGFVISGLLLWATRANQRARAAVVCAIACLFGTALTIAWNLSQGSDWSRIPAIVSGWHGQLAGYFAAGGFGCCIALIAESADHQ